MGVEYSPNVLNFEQSKSSNITQSIVKQNTKKFLKYTSDEEIKIFESVAGDVLDILGYERVSIVRGQEIKFSPVDIHRFNLINCERKVKIRNQTEVS